MTIFLARYSFLLFIYQYLGYRRMCLFLTLWAVIGYEESRGTLKTSVCPTNRFFQRIPGIITHNGLFLRGPAQEEEVPTSIASDINITAYHDSWPFKITKHKISNHAFWILCANNDNNKLNQSHHTSIHSSHHTSIHSILHHFCHRARYWLLTSSSICCLHCDRKNGKLLSSGMDKINTCLWG